MLSEIHELSVDFKRIWDVILVLEGVEEANLELEQNLWIWLIIKELAFNCVEQNEETDVEMGTKQVNVVLNMEEKMLLVKDDRVHKHPTKVLRVINYIKESGRAGTTKPRPPDHDFGPWGGFGLLMSVRLLKEHNGELTHKIEDRKIVTEATWKS